MLGRKLRKAREDYEIYNNLYHSNLQKYNRAKKENESIDELILPRMNRIKTIKAKDEWLEKGKDGLNALYRSYIMPVKTQTKQPDRRNETKEISEEVK